MEPVSGLPGTTVTISGIFDDSLTHTVSVEGTSANVTAVTPDTVTFSIPSGANSGTIVIDDSLVPTKLPLPLIILRQVSGTFTPPPGISRSGYFAGTSESFNDVAANGSFTALFEKDSPATIIVARSESDPAYLARILSVDNNITVDAASTARALVLTNPALGSHSDSQTSLQSDFISTRPEFSTLTDLITSNGASGYLNDARVDTQLVALVSATQQAPLGPQGLFKPYPGDDVLTYGVKLRELNPDPNSESNPILQHSKSLNSSVKVDPSNARNLFLDYPSSRDTRLDWTISLNELSPWDFPGGINDIRDLALNDPDTAPTPIGPPLQYGWVRATLDSAKLDYFGNSISAISNGVAGLIGDGTTENPSHRFTVPRNDPKIYLLTATSGNIWYGTDWINVNANNQAASLEKSDPGYQWELSAASNALLAATDAVGVLLSVKDIGEAADGYIKTAIFTLAKTLTAYRNGDQAFSKAAFYELAKSLASDLTKQFAVNQAKKLPDQAAKLSIHAFHGASFAFKQIDVLGKISSGLQALERAGTLFSPGTLAMERSILVVGDPFAPRITGISPLTARAGDKITITGSGFGTEAPTVSFCQFPESIPRGQEPSQIGSPLAAVVSENTDNRLVIEVPQGFSARFTTLKAHLCIEKSTDIKSDSFSLGEQGIFTLIPPPVITALDPAPQDVGGTITLIGENFIGQRPEVRVNGTIVGSSVIDDTHLLIILPGLSTVPDHTLTVTYGSVVSAPFTFRVTRPIHIVDDTLQSGASITVTLLNTSNAADDEISILEALLLANGSLGRALTQNESFKVSPPDKAGANRRDVISLPFGGGNVLMTAPLPPITSGDKIRFRDVVLDGQNLPAGTHGLLLDGATDTEISSVTLKNFSGDGLRLVNGSSGNTLSFFTIDGSGDKGLFINNECHHNTFVDTHINQSGGDGFTLSGFCNNNSFTNTSIDTAGGTGALIEDNVTWNSFTGFTVSTAGNDGLVLTDNASSNRFISTVEIDDVTGTGLVLNGTGVKHNSFYSTAFEKPTAYRIETAIRDCTQYGALFENGASQNILGLKFASNCDRGGIFLSGPDTWGNTVGRIYLRSPSASGQLGEQILYSLIADCGTQPVVNPAHGILLSDAPRNTLTALNISGCTGDAFRLEGASCQDNQLLSVRTGVSDFIENVDPVASPNMGASIRIRDQASRNIIAAKIEIFIGTFGGGNVSYYLRNRLSNDLAGGLIIEEDAFANELRDTDIGGTPTDDGEGAVGANGIAILTGAHSNKIGSNHYREPTYINACPESAVLIDGPASINNVLTGLNIGIIAHRGVSSSAPDERQNTNGITLQNLTSGNKLGTAGPLTERPPSFFGTISNVTLVSTNALEAAITLDNASGIVLANGDLSSPNEIICTSASGSLSGLRITGGAQANVIGSRDSALSNRFSTDQEGTACIHIDNNQIDRPELNRNRFYNNSTTINGTAEDTDLFTTDVPVGLLISDNSQGNVFGESLHINYIQGAKIDSSSGNWLRDSEFNIFGATQWGSSTGHSLAILLLDASNNLIGGPTTGNLLGSAWSTAAPAQNPNSAGLAIVGGQNNTVSGNIIDDISGHGIIISNSRSNLIGGSSIPEGNEITANSLSGIMLAGHTCQDNFIQGNRIGASRNNQNLGNSENGILIKDAALSNTIGGAIDSTIGATAFRRRLSPGTIAGNVIAYNGIDGVQVSGSGTENNAILFNSIHTNNNRGIALTGGGNSSKSLDISGSYTRGTATGTVNNLSEIPVGSTLQFFGDSDTEGEVYLGQTTVQTGGGFLAYFRPNPFTQLTVTATTPETAVFGETTEFQTIDPANDLALTLNRPGSPTNRTVSFSNNILPVLSFAATSTGASTRITDLTVQAGGTLNEATEIDSVALYLDHDADGEITDRDEKISEDEVFTTNDGQLTFKPENLVIPEDQTRQLIVAYHGSGATGRTATLEITEANSVTGHFILPPLSAAPLATFPIQSDTLTLGTPPPGLSFSGWQTQNFPGQSNPSVIGALADPDRDQTPNLLEFLFGTDPNNPNSSAFPIAVTPTGQFGIEFPYAKNLEGITVTYETSPDLETWTPFSSGAYSVTFGDPTHTARYLLPNTHPDQYIRLRATLGSSD
ncbi:MAG: right-handed parallel beta-helix repeat-containing protein [Verrucomicrobiaceae bacterium]